MLWYKGVENMKIWFNRLVAGKVTFDEISEKYQQGVKELAKEKVEQGLMPIEQYEKLFGEPYIE